MSKPLVLPFGYSTLLWGHGSAPGRVASHRDGGCGCSRSLAREVSALVGSVMNTSVISSLLACDDPCLFHHQCGIFLVVIAIVIIL